MKAKTVLLVSIFAVLLSISACSTQRNAKQSEADSVKQALEQADLKDLRVSDDADKNTITITGTLHSDDAKARAGDVAKSAVPDRIIANEISVQPLGNESEAKGVASNLDDGIEKNYKAALISKRLDKASIHYDAKNGVLVLSGRVKKPQQKTEAALLAEKIPNVHQVVNQIEVQR